MCCTQYGKLSDIFGRKSSVLAAYVLFLLGIGLWYVFLVLPSSLVVLLTACHTTVCNQVAAVVLRQPFGI